MEIISITLFLIGKQNVCSKWRTDFRLGDYIPSFEEYNFEGFSKSHKSISWCYWHKVGSGVWCYPYKGGVHANPKFVSDVKMTPLPHMPEGLKGRGQQGGSQAGPNMAGDSRKRDCFRISWWLWGGTWVRYHMQMGTYGVWTPCWCHGRKDPSLLISLLRCGQRGRGRVRLKSCQSQTSKDGVRLFITGTHAVRQYRHHGLRKFKVTGLTGSAPWSVDLP